MEKRYGKRIKNKSTPSANMVEDTSNLAIKSVAALSEDIPSSVRCSVISMGLYGVCRNYTWFNSWEAFCLGGYTQCYL